MTARRADRVRLVPVIPVLDADLHALCGIGFFHSRWTPQAVRCRSKRPQRRTAAAKPDWVGCVAYARAHLQAARQLGFKGSFLAASRRFADRQSPFTAS
jgi:hypothetical protein